MITLEQARKFYPKDQCPPDDVILRVLASSYRLAEMEWDIMMDEKAAERKKKDGKKNL